MLGGPLVLDVQGALTPGHVADDRTRPVGHGHVRRAARGRLPAGGRPLARRSPTSNNSVTLIVVATAEGTVGGTVPATLSLTLGAPASFGAFTPGVAQ